jgi:hypothetical protein
MNHTRDAQSGTYGTSISADIITGGAQTEHTPLRRFPQRRFTENKMFQPKQQVFCLILIKSPVGPLSQWQR